MLWAWKKGRGDIIKLAAVRRKKSGEEGNNEPREKEDEVPWAGEWRSHEILAFHQSLD